MHSRLVSSDASLRLSNSALALNAPCASDAGAFVDAAGLAEMLADCALPGETLVVGVTGSVAAGKTTLCNAIASHLRSTQRVETISTDGFLLPNDILAARGLSLRKGFPETYDRSLMTGTLQRVRWGPVCVPGYSHRLYDRDKGLDRTINRPDIVLVEGLGLSPGPAHRDPSALLDILIYVDAEESDLEAWFVRRFMEFWREAESNPASFYTRFRSMDEAQAEMFAKTVVWTGMNLPNLRDHIQFARDRAHVVLKKTANHQLQLVHSDRSEQN